MWRRVGLLALLTLGATAIYRSGADAQTPPPAYFSSLLSVVWDHSGKDTAGRNETLKEAEIGLFSAGVNPNGAGVQALATARGLPAIPTAPQLVGPQLFPATRAEGVYQLAARVVDQAGNISAWGATIVGELDKTSPAAPGAPRVQIIINIGGGP